MINKFLIPILRLNREFYYNKKTLFDQYFYSRKNFYVPDAIYIEEIFLLKSIFILFVDNIYLGKINPINCFLKQLNYLPYYFK